MKTSVSMIAGKLALAGSAVVLAAGVVQAQALDAQAGELRVVEVRADGGQATQAPRQQGGDARALLQRFTATVKTATGQFSQESRDAQGQSLSAMQTGRFSFERPGKFRWAVDQPFEQLILADGQQLYQYDPDLLQVSIRPMSQALGASPAALLFGSTSLEENFTLAPQPDRDGLAWLRATPRQTDAGFSHVDIGFGQALPEVLELLDAFGQKTRIRLSNIQVNPTLPAEEFHFSAPDGVDVVRM